MKKILIINAHPDKESLSFKLAEKYLQGAVISGADVKFVNLAELSFSPVLKFGYKQRTELEPDLVAVQQEIKNAEHIVIVYPNWWGTYPALLKGFFDRVMLPGFAFKYRENSILWDKLLTGKTARIMITMDTPKWYYSLIYKKPGINAVKKSVLEFCGIKPVKVNVFSPVKTASDEKRNKWLDEAYKLGKELK